MDGKAVRLPHDQNRHIHADDHVQLVKRLVDTGLRKIAFKRGVAVADGQDVYRDRRAFSGEKLRSYVEKCVSCEEAVKTGRMNDVMSVELLLVKYS